MSLSFFSDQNLSLFEAPRCLLHIIQNITTESFPVLGKSVKCKYSSEWYESAFLPQAIF